MIKESSPYIGIDVSKDHLDVYRLHDGTSARFSNDSAGICDLITAYCKEDSIVIAEPTGGYEMLLVTSLQETSIDCCLVPPQRVKSFAKARGVLAKTDRLDAISLAHYGDVMQPIVRQYYHDVRLSNFVKRRRQLVNMLTMERNRQQQSHDELFAESLAQHCQWLEQSIKDIEHTINDHIEKCEVLSFRKEVLLKESGIGEVTAAVLLSELTELGSVSGKEISALTGTAPYNRDSGNKQGKRFTHGGRKSAKHALYMATLSAIRYNDNIKAFYKRLRAKGKIKKVAIAACMRKLIVILNAKMRDALLAQLMVMNAVQK